LEAAIGGVFGFVDFLGESVGIDADEAVENGGDKGFAAILDPERVDGDAANGDGEGERAAAFATAVDGAARGRDIHFMFLLALGHQAKSVVLDDVEVDQAGDQNDSPNDTKPRHEG
jgi:hypothetical protein